MIPAIAPLTANPQHSGFLGWCGTWRSHVVHSAASLANPLLIARSCISEHVHFTRVDASKAVEILPFLFLWLAVKLRIKATSHRVCVSEHHGLRARQLTVVKNIGDMAARTPTFALLGSRLEGIATLSTSNCVSLH